MSKQAVLLVNLGSPDSTNPNDVKKYLDEFLMDKYVIDYPYLFRALLVKGIILNTRPKKSAAAYKKIWWEEGSPLIILSQRVQKQLQRRLDVPVGLAMRYGNPSIEHGIRELKKENPNLEQLFIIPLYPQYAESTVRTIEEKAKQVVAKNKWNIQLSFQPVFYQDKDYIAALGDSIKPYLDQYDHFLFSYHGIPERHVKKTDPTNAHCLQVENCCQKICAPAQEKCYRHHCFETTKYVVEYLGLKEDQYTISFQSRLGNDPWIKPYTDYLLEEMPTKGITSLAVICPAFVSDCLETLEEISMEGKEEFMHAGGKSFTQIPCLNENEAWIDVLEKFSNQFLNTFDADNPDL